MHCYRDVSRTLQSINDRILRQNSWCQEANYVKFVKMIIVKFIAVANAWTKLTGPGLLGKAVARVENKM